jgi:hypothetical protein
MALIWFCVRTQSRREELARERLEDIGVVVYLPREMISTARQRGRQRVMVEYARPLIPRHLFVGLSEPLGARYRAVLESDGVERLLTTETHGAPCQVPWRAIAILQTVEGELRDDYERRRARTRTKRRAKPDEVISALKKAAPEQRAEILMGYVERKAGVTLKLGDLKAAVEERLATN